MAFFSLSIFVTVNVVLYSNFLRLAVSQSQKIVIKVTIKCGKDTKYIFKAVAKLEGMISLYLPRQNQFAKLNTCSRKRIAFLISF